MPKFRMFIDDTGCIKDAASNHPQQRYGGIVGVIFDTEYLEKTFEPGFSKLRLRHFDAREDGSPPILHLRKMKNPNPNGPFAKLKDPKCRKAWNDDVFSMYRRASYSVISVCVDKIQFYANHPDWEGSIYEMLVGNAIERFFYFLRGNGTGDVMAEATNSELDLHLKSLYNRFYDNGAQHITAKQLQSVLTSRDIKIKPKSKNIAGLQFADMLASTCFSHSRKLHANGPDFDPFAMQVASLIETEKYYRNPNTNNPHGYGRIWRP